MAAIKVPKTPAKAFDPDRRISDLLRRQVEHLEWALRPAAQRQPHMVKVRATTEGQAAKRIEKLTAAVLDQARKDAAAAPGGYAAQAGDTTQIRIAVPANPPKPARRRKPSSRTAAKRARVGKASVGRRTSKPSRRSRGRKRRQS
jgi:hypothetical protein